LRCSGTTDEKLLGTPSFYVNATCRRFQFRRALALDIIAKPDDDSVMRYPGGKGKSFPQLINLFPPHVVYIETHLGAGAILRNKRPAELSIAIDRDKRLIAQWKAEHPRLATYIAGDATDFLSTYRFTGNELCYCDPPYVHSTRKQKKIYLHEYTDADHQRLLAILRKLPCHVAISGYPSDLYDSVLNDWNVFEYRAKAHDGLRLERVWYNYPTPHELHDARYLGSTFREREVIRRRLTRIKSRIGELSVAERHVLQDWLHSSLKPSAAP
jgi:DNA adenine methylase